MIRLAVLLSGSGRTLQNFIDRIKAGTFDATIEIVISSKEGVQGIDRARSAGIPTVVIPRRNYPSDREFSEAVTQALRKAQFDLIALAGFVHLYHFPGEWRGKVLNIHPALLPKYGGKGYYGHRVHEAVLRSKDIESGCTVHFADSAYDTGPIILQKRVPIHRGDTPELLAARVFEAECQAYPEAIEQVARGRVKFSP
jgi:formyltetrahydrofolate-dependent phosphoribosylglycinamide formyltransferase